VDHNLLIITFWQFVLLAWSTATQCVLGVPNLKCCSPVGQVFTEFFANEQCSSSPLPGLLVAILLRANSTQLGDLDSRTVPAPWLSVGAQRHQFPRNQLLSSTHDLLALIGMLQLPPGIQTTSGGGWIFLLFECPAASSTVSAPANSEVKL
jgi:hypothetical protein